MWHILTYHHFGPFFYRLIYISMAIGLRSFYSHKHIPFFYQARIHLDACYVNVNTAYDFASADSFNDVIQSHGLIF